MEPEASPGSISRAPEDPPRDQLRSARGAIVRPLRLPLLIVELPLSDMPPVALVPVPVPVPPDGLVVVPPIEPPDVPDVPELVPVLVVPEPVVPEPVVPVVPEPVAEPVVPEPVVPVPVPVPVVPDPVVLCAPVPPALPVLVPVPPPEVLPPEVPPDWAMEMPTAVARSVAAPTLVRLVINLLMSVSCVGPLAGRVGDG